MLALTVTGVLLMGWLEVSLASQGCPEANAVQNYNLTRDLGLWWVAAWAGTPTMTFYTENRCVSIFNQINDNGTMTYVLTGINTNTGKMIQETTVADIIRPGVFNKTIGSEENCIEDTFWILGINYDRWSVGESCMKQTAWGDHSVVCWIVSRNSRKQLSVEDDIAINKVLQANGFDRSQFIDTNIDGYCNDIYDKELKKTFV